MKKKHHKKQKSLLMLVLAILILASSIMVLVTSTPISYNHTIQRKVASIHSLSDAERRMLPAQVLADLAVLNH